MQMPNSEENIEKTYKERGAWSVWRHPSRSAREHREMLRQLAEAASMADRLSDLEGKLHVSNEELAKIQAAAEESKKRETDLRRQLEIARKDIATLRQELSQRREVGEMMKEFEAKCAEIEQMKQTYEKRIENLRLQLKDARAAHRRDRHEATDLLDDIAGPIIFDDAPRTATSPKSPQRPKFATQNPKTPNIGKGDGPTPKNTPEDPTDWYTPLPDI